MKTNVNTQLTKPVQQDVEVLERVPHFHPAESDKELFRLRASRMSELFPDELIIREKTISVIKNYMIYSDTQTIPIKDIGRVEFVDTPVFVGMQIFGKNTAHHLEIHGLYRKQAFKARKILQALVLLEQSEVPMPYFLQVDPQGELMVLEGDEIEPVEDVSAKKY